MAWERVSVIPHPYSFPLKSRSSFRDIISPTQEAADARSLFAQCLTIRLDYNDRATGGWSPCGPCETSFRQAKSSCNKIHCRTCHLSSSEFPYVAQALPGSETIVVRARTRWADVCKFFRRSEWLRGWTSKAPPLEFITPNCAPRFVILWRRLQPRDANISISKK